MRNTVRRVRLLSILAGRRVAAIVPSTLMNILFFGGLAAVTYGAWMIYRPLGPIAGGLFAVWTGFNVSLERK